MHRKVGIDNTHLSVVLEVNLPAQHIQDQLLLLSGVEAQKLIFCGGLKGYFSEHAQKTTGHRRLQFQLRGLIVEHVHRDLDADQHNFYIFIMRVLIIDEIVFVLFQPQLLQLLYDNIFLPFISVALMRASLICDNHIVSFFDLLHRL